jgi:hypothetical protein
MDSIKILSTVTSEEKSVLEQAKENEDALRNKINNYYSSRVRKGVRPEQIEKEIEKIFR